MASYDQLDYAALFRSVNRDKPAEDPAKSRGFVRGAADLGLEAASGVTRGVGMLANVFGANNAVSQGARSADEFIREYLSAQSKEDSARASAILAEAEDAGIGDQLRLACGAFAQNPVSTTVNALGQAVPVIAGALIPGMGPATVAGRVGMAGIGAAQGAGAVKGSIFDAVKTEQMRQPGMTEADATAAAEEAQSYTGQNTGNIPSGAALGGVAGSTGFQPAAARILTRSGMLSQSTQQIEQGLLRKIGADKVADAAETRAGGALTGALVEGGTEFAQGGQEQYAANVALQREGFDVPTFRGVVSQGVMEAVAGGALGAGFGALEKPRSTRPTIQDIAEAPTVDDAIKAFTNVLALPAPATKASWEVVDGQQLLQGPATQPSQPATGMLGLPAPTGQPVLMADQFGNVTTQPATQRAEAVSRANMAMAEAEQATAAQRQRAQELGKQTPRGESPPDLIPTGEATDLEQLPTGSATELDVETIQADDFLTADNQPYGTKTGAAVRARREGLGPANVVAVPGGWVVRPQPTALSLAGQEVQPNNTRGTRDGDVLRAPNVNQRDMADAAAVAVPAADGRLGDGIAGGGTVRPVADAGGAGQLQPGVPTPAGSGDGNVAAGRGSGKPGPLIPAEGTPLTLDGKPYTVAAAGKRYVTIADASGKERVISDGSYLWPKVQRALAGAAPAEGAAAQTQPTIGAPNDAATPQQAAEAPRSQTPAPAATAGAAVATGADTAAGGSAGVEAGGVTPQATAPTAPKTLKERMKAPKFYKTRANAEAAKAGNTQRIRKTKDGFILRQATDKELAAAEKAGRRLAGAGVDVEKDSLLAAIAKLGGLAIRERADTVGTGNKNVGGKMVFRLGGQPLDELAAGALREYGYVPANEVERDGGTRWLRDAIRAEFNGLNQFFSEQGTEAIMDRQRAQEEADFMASQEAEGIFDDLDADEVQASGYTAASPEIQAMTERLVAEAEALGVDVESIRERVSMASNGSTQDEYEFAVQQALIEAIERTRSDAARRDAGTAAGSGEDRGQAADGQGQEEGLKRRAPRPFEPQSREFEHAGKTYRITVDRYWGIDTVQERYEPDLLSWTAQVQRQERGASWLESIAGDKIPKAVAIKANAFFENVRDVDAGGDLLTTQTAEDLQAKTEREESATKSAASQKAAEQERLRREAEARDMRARADATVDDFQLGQDANTQMSGMGDLFAEPATPSEPAERYAAGKALTKAERKQVLETLVDVYKAKGAPREQKGVGRDGNERYGYVHSPELFEKSDITGAMVRYYVTLPDGRMAHPSELFPDYTQSDIDAEIERRAAAERNDAAQQKRVEDLLSEVKATTPADAEAEFMKRNSGFQLRGWNAPKDRTFVPFTNDGRYYVAVSDDAAMMARLERAGWTRATPQAAADKPAAEAQATIEDVGEKIGGARKDTAVSTGTTRRKSDDDRPAWARRFQVSEIVTLGGMIGEVKDAGRWIIRDTKSVDWMGQAKQVGRTTYATKEEADAFVPIAAVGLKHRPVPTSGGKYEIWRDVSDRKRVKVVEQQFDTRDEAMAYMAQNAVAIVETNTTFGEADLPLPPDRKRAGPARRDGNVRGEDFKESFGLRGVEFGNWNNQDERQALMNDAWDGLMDLADVMGIPPKAIGLNGDLALAFGARGHGLNSARAHYELDRAVINLTKERGAGSLAHEWFHALDHYFGRQDGKASAAWVVNKDGTRSLKPGRDATDNMASGGFTRNRSGVRPEVRAAYEKLLTTMTKRAETYVEDMAKVDKFTGATREDLASSLDSLRRDLSEQKDVRYYKRNNKPASAELLAEFDVIAKAMIDGDMAALATDWRLIKSDKAKTASRWTNDTLERLSAIYKEVRGRSGFDGTNQNGLMDRLRGNMNRYSQRLKMLADAQTGAEKQRMVPTEFAREARELDQGRGGDYWTTPHEMAARAFQGYVEDKIATQGGTSRFLNYGPENAGILTPWGFKRPYPTGAERIAINKALDEFVGELKTRTDDAGNVALFSRATGQSTTPAQLRTALETEFTPETIGALERAGLLTIADRPGRGMPSDAAGVTQGGSIGLFAANTAPGSVAVAYHEALHATLKATVGDAYAPLMARLAKIAASAEIPQIGARAEGPMNRFFKQAAGRIPDDVTGEARLEELAAYTVESFQANRERMPMLLRRWASDFMAAVRVGLSKALQAAGVGLRIRARLLADPATLHKLARDGLQAMARQGMQGDAAMAFSQQAAGPKWFSALKRAVDGLSMGAAPAQGWKDSIKGLVTKGSVKADEVEWTGLTDWLDLQQGKVTKAQVSDFLAANGVQVTETVLGGTSSRRGLLDIMERNDNLGFDTPGQALDAVARDYRRKPSSLDNWDMDPGERQELRDGLDAGQDAGTTSTKYNQYTLPGGTNYREVLLTLPPSQKRLSADEQLKQVNAFKRAMLDKYGDRWQSKATAAELETNNRLSMGMAAETYAAPDYRSSHWDAPNVLAHIRVNDRTDADGKRVLFVEEIQSDFGAEMRKQKEAIGKAVDDDFTGIIERMKKAGVLEVNCD